MNVETPTHTINDAAMVGNNGGNLLSEEMEHHIENERPDEELTPMVSELVLGITDTNVMNGDHNDHITVNKQPVREQAESELVRDEGNGLNLQFVAINPVDGNIGSNLQTVAINPVDGNIQHCESKKK